MKPAAFLGKNPAYLYFKDPSLVSNAMLKADITNLYTAAEIADFVKGLYFDDDFRLDKNRPVFAQIAEKIEEANRKDL